MALLQTKHQKKSFVITTILYLLLLLLLIFLGLKYFDPPKEKGILVNFGTTELGQGDTQPNRPVQSAPENNTPDTTPQTESSTSEVVEEVTTQDNTDAPVIKDEKDKTKTTPEENKPKEEKTKEEVKETKTTQTEKKPDPKPDPKPDKAVTDAMDNLLNGPQNEGDAQNGEGNDNTSGDKGNPDGDPNAKSYYGTGKGLDGDGNYRLGGRKALSKTKYTQDCNESGTVVVKIEVDKNGKVIKAVAGAKGTTNNDPCLLNPAKRAALDTKFNKDSKAPSRQVGYITYVFKLSE